MKKCCAYLMAALFVSCGFAFGQDPSFQIIQGGFTWQEAKADAEAKGGQLATLNTQDKIDAAKTYLDGLSSQQIGEAWIGLTNNHLDPGSIRNRPDEYLWVTGEGLTASNWHPGTPNNAGGNGGGGATAAKLMRWSGGSVYGWDDDFVDLRRNYLLEILDPTPAAPSITFYPSDGSNGVGINATVTAERVEDRFGVANKAFKLSGEDGITDENFELNGSSMSFSLWLKVDENQTGGYPHVFRFGDSDGWPSIALALNRNTDLAAIHDVRSGVQKSVSASRLQFGSWYHAAIVTNNNQFYFYLNGNLIGSSNLDLSVTGPKFWTGGTVPFAGGGFQGTLDEIKVFNYALDDDSIEALANNKTQEPFQVVEGNFTWKEAKANAEATGGRLAVLDTQEKIDSISDLLESFDGSLWIGLTDEVNEGEWKWINGEALTVNNWGTGQPDGEGEDYAHIFWKEGNKGDAARRWNDVVNDDRNAGPGVGNYNNKKGYLLEILAQTPTAPTLPVLESFYESNPGETIVIDATPTKGYPTNFIYQWTFNGFPVPAFLGGADATLSLNGTSDQNGTWRVQVTNSEGSAEASFEYRVFVDNDSDTLSNYREENITLTNPNLADSDSDGLSDSEEIAAETDPNIADTDEDGVSDGAEVNTYASNPKKKDTDDDGLSDGDEINTYLSNPNNSDSDSDGISDASEVAAGLDLNTADTIASAVAFLTEELANRPDGFDEAMALARSAGQNDVTSNPSTYGLYGESAYNAIILERDARFLDSDEDGITDEKEAELETDASSETVFYLQEGLDSATANARAAGRSDVTTNPLDYALTTKAAYDGVVTERDARPTQAESDAAVSQARVAGRSDVMIDPASYSLFSAEAYTAVVAERDARPTLTAYNTAIVESLATGRSSVTNNPGDYGLYQAAEYNAVVAERDARPTQEAYTAVVAERDTRFLDSDEDGITDEKEAELETDTSKETVFYLQGALDTATADARSSGRSDVTTNPLDYALITKVAYDIVVAERDERPTVLACDTAVVEALSAGRLSVTSNPSEYGLYDSVAYNTVVAERDLRPTINAYNTAVADALTAGRLSVTTNPSGYGLYNAASYNAIIAERDARPSQAALDAVIAERDARPTPDQIKDARLGSVVLVPNIIGENEQIVQIRFRIEESNDLGIWESRQEVAEVNIPIKPGKKFYRFSVNED
ncbi:hypothetical protein N9B03_03695 [Akkermansiaceae bacterium]|nr:hypothetical protein [Akkermansiaceae bacterium]